MSYRRENTFINGGNAALRAYIQLALLANRGNMLGARRTVKNMRRENLYLIRASRIAYTLGYIRHNPANRVDMPRMHVTVRWTHFSRGNLRAKNPRLLPVILPSDC